MTEPTYLPDAKMVPFGSEAMEHLRFALLVLERERANLPDPVGVSDELDVARFDTAIETLRWMTTEAV